MKLPRLAVALVTAAASVTAAITVTSGATAAEPLIRDAGGPTAVKDSYIVVLNDSATVGTAAQRLVRAHGGTIGSVWTHALRGFSITAPEAVAAKLAADPAVDFVSQNHTVRATATQSPVPSWGLDRIDQADLPLDGSYTYPDSAGGGVHAYIIDTGIRITHDDFGGRASHGYDFVDNDANADDCNGHGTHVAGTVAGTVHGVAKLAELVAVRVLDCAGSGTFQGVIDGVDWVTANAVKPAVANMSLGASGSNSALESAVANSIASGVTYALAAGNSGANACNFTPARTPEAITVGATDINDNRAPFSNYGTCVDIFAPGVNITSTWIGSDSDTNTISGTSMAAPHVAGVAALILGENPGWSAQQVRDHMVGNATPDRVANPGTGSPNLLLFVGDGGTTPPPDCIGTNGTDVAIPDRGTATSTIAISGCTGNGSASSTVEVHIVHPSSGHVEITLIAPDGSSYQLKGRSNDNSANVDETYTVNLSSEGRNGTWSLQVRDRRRNSTGFINSWSLNL